MGTAAAVFRRSSGELQIAARIAGTLASPAVAGRLAPERVAAPEPAPEPSRAVSPAPALQAWPSTPEPARLPAWVIAVALAAGTLIPSLLAYRSDDFGTGQVGYVAITCLIAILAALSLLPMGARGRSPRSGVLVAWLLAGYALLETLPWSRHLLNLGMPHKGTIALSAIGLGIALAIAGAAGRWREQPDTAADTIS